MTTIIYHCITSLANICNTVVNAGMKYTYEKHIDENEQIQIEEKNYVTFCKYIETCNEKYYKHKEIYKKIIQVFEGEILEQKSRDAKDEITLIFKIHKRYNKNLVKEMCDNKLKELMETDKYKDTILDFSFFCAYNMFVDISTQTMDTLNKICTLRLESEDDDDFRQKLINDIRLFKKYVLSVNWCIKLNDTEIDYKLLHNFKSISVKKTYIGKKHKMTVYYRYRDLFKKYKHNKDIINYLIDTIPNYYENKKIIKTKKVFKYENTKNITELIMNNKFENNKKLKLTVNLTLNALAVERGKFTEIFYFSQSSYYGLEEKKRKYKICLNYYQNDFIRELCCDESFKTKLKMKFDTLSMHTNYSILCTYMLSIEQENNIKNLTKCFDEYANMLMDCIQDKYKTAIAKFFDDLIDNNKQTDESANPRDAKQMYLDILERINCKPKITEEMNPDNKEMNPKITKETNAEKLTINNVKKYYETEYKPLFEKIDSYSGKKSALKECFNKIHKRTQYFLDKQIGVSAVIADITKITNLKKQIEENKKQIIDDVANTFAKQTDPTLFFDSVQAKNKSFKIVSDQNKQIKEDKKTYKERNKNLPTYNDVVESKINSYIIDKNKDKITNILKDTIQMKNMIIKAENDANKFTSAIEFYIAW
ncbi:hypothetical protein BDAP_000949 [Binucleata daphniae]